MRLSASAWSIALSIAAVSLARASMQLSSANYGRGARGLASPPNLQPRGSSFSLSMIFSENRYPLFGIML